jgi:hypothetical protein
MNFKLLEKYERSSERAVPLKIVHKVLGCSRRTVTNWRRYPALHPRKLDASDSVPFMVATEHLRARHRRLTN